MAQQLSLEGSKLFRIRKTCLKMLSKRGYNVADEHISGSNASATQRFIEQFGDNPSREQMTILVEKVDDPSDRIFVFFPDEEKVGVKTIRTYGDRMKDENVRKSIIVVRGGMTPLSRDANAQLCQQRGVQIEDFKDAELMVDITDHVLVPEHQVLNNEEKAELLKRYKLTDTQLPRIHSTDPVARYYGLQRGQVVKIIRPSETAGRYVTYRLCM
ncbi:RNA polymerase Rpb5, C-terminal domain-containing protein [Tribonema minus]|uniref:RNA polymerase Rpb5, C-terminal domain-containing protein n=1 Tax=Tribonema minus TaxID=303371 RepID=A0A835YLJ3_9STRA|nr:RNA polymerase Rpb5, C-terminal domain-containing protein [Tribonema minus]|eukprot:TRINITY_DN29618_c0_g1_i1.p1 TRINITY_DN29618_c0_g1~~TRINITY_DN29618_c0_g1_i1.p1  ORF type:complete len:214 (-),score=60.99 TRINITY_DN29618_c0_g1_i1:40-681(-)